MNWRVPEKNFEDLFLLENTCGCVLGPWPQAFLSLASRGSVLEKAVLGLGFFFVSSTPPLHLFTGLLRQRKRAVLILHVYERKRKKLSLYLQESK